jgi:CheY-like chemotaxis protein
MPGEDGYELIRKIRALKNKGRAKTPAIALTGFAGADDKSQAIAAGYQLHVSKPVDLGSLTAEIALLTQNGQKRSSPKRNPQQ